jgi:hypothetical protein
MLISLTFLFSLVSCDKEDATDVTKDQELFFEVYHINQAWGTSFGGFLIDKKGDIRTFGLDPKYWNLPSEEGIISFEKIRENLDKTNLSSSRIAKDVFEKFVQKIDSIQEGNYTDEKNVMYDAGAIVYNCYKYDKSSNCYKLILLDQLGDWEISNKDQYAIQIANWLKSLYVPQSLSNNFPTEE